MIKLRKYENAPATAPENRVLSFNQYTLHYILCSVFFFAQFFKNFFQKTKKILAKRGKVLYNKINESGEKWS